MLPLLLPAGPPPESPRDVSYVWKTIPLRFFHPSLFLKCTPCRPTEGTNFLLYHYWDLQWPVRSSPCCWVLGTWDSVTNVPESLQQAGVGPLCCSRENIPLHGLTLNLAIRPPQQFHLCPEPLRPAPVNLLPSRLKPSRYKAGSLLMSPSSWELK